MTQIEKIDELISRDRNAYTDQTEEPLNEFLKKMTIKINMVILSEFAKKGTRYIEIKILSKPYEFFLEEDGFKTNFDLKDPIFCFILFEVYKGAEETMLFGEKMNFVIEPVELLKNLREKKLHEYFKLMSKIISIETVLNRLIEEIELNSNYLERDHKEIVIGTSKIKNGVHEIAFLASLNMEENLKQIYKTKQLAMEIIEPTGATEYSEEAKQYVDKLLEFLKDSEVYEAGALEQLSFLNVSNRLTEMFENKMKKNKEYKTDLKINQEKISEELSKVDSYESGQIALKNIIDIIIEENKGITGKQLTEAYLYVFNLVRPGSAEKMEKHLKQIEDNPDGIITICGQCDGKQDCASLHLLYAKNKLDFPHIM